MARAAREGIVLSSRLGLALGAAPALCRDPGSCFWACLSAGVGKLWRLLHPAIAGVHIQPGGSCTCEMAHTCHKSTFTPASNAAIGFSPSPASVSNFRTCSHFGAGLPLLSFSPLSWKRCTSIPFISLFSLERNLQPFPVLLLFLHVQQSQLSEDVIAF